MKCFACDHKIETTTTRKPTLVDTRDGQRVFVGADCAAKVMEAGDAGYQPPKGGPKLYPLPPRV